MRVAVLVVAVCALSCSGGDAEVRTETQPFPTAMDAWSNGTPGTLTMGSEVDAVRIVTVPAVEVDVTLRFTRPLECGPNLSLTTTLGGIGVVAAMLPDAGATEGHAKMRFPRGFTGTASLRLSWVNSGCGSIEIDMSRSTVTFAGAVVR